MCRNQAFLIFANNSRSAQNIKRQWKYDIGVDHFKRGADNFSDYFFQGYQFYIKKQFYS